MNITTTEIFEEVSRVLSLPSQGLTVGYTSEDLAGQANVSLHTIRKVLKGLQKTGRLRVTIGPKARLDGVITKVPYYSVHSAAS